MDAANVDLKAFTEKFYRTLCTGQLGAVLETLEYIRHETDVWFEITTLLIPGENDGADEVAELSGWVMDRLGPDVPLHFTAFHPDFRMLDTPPTPKGTLTAAREIARAAGLPLRLHRQRARRARPEHLLPQLRRLRHRPRLVPDHPLAADAGRTLHRLRGTGGGHLRAGAGDSGAHGARRSGSAADEAAGLPPATPPRAPS